MRRVITDHITFSVKVTGARILVSANRPVNLKSEKAPGRSFTMDRGGILGVSGDSTVEIQELCTVEQCAETAVTHCARCGQALCRRHAIADYTHLPGGQRPYCPVCDAERRRLYETVRVGAPRVILWSGIGAVLGAVVGRFIGVLATPDSFAHAITTDLGFVAGLAGALFIALESTRPRSTRSPNDH